MIVEYKRRESFFDKVTFFQKIFDILTAIIHSFFGLHKTRYPFSLYFQKLSSYIESEEPKIKYQLHYKKNKIDDSSDEYKRLSSDEIQRKIVSTEADVSEKESEVSEAEKLKLFQEDEFNEKYNDVKDRYEKWYKCLGRWPYFEIFNYRLMFNLDRENRFKEKDENDKDGSNKNSSIIKTIYKKIVSLLKNVFYIAYPMEVYFALPAFQFITPENKHAAWAGAVILVGSLYLLGYFSGSLLNRSKMNIIDMSMSHTTPKGITVFVNKYFSVIFTFVVILSVMVVLTGTALRTMVFSVERNIDSVEEINKKITIAETNRDNSIKIGNAAEVDSYKKEIKDLNQKREDTISKREEIRKQQSLIPTTADGYLALSIYITLYIAPLLSTILKTDPYFEYHLVASEASLLEEIKYHRESHKYNYINAKKDELAELKNRLAQLKNILDVTRDGNDKSIKNTTENLATSGLESFIDIAKSWRKQRMITYYTTYMLFSGTKIKNLYKDEKEDNYLC